MKKYYCDICGKEVGQNDRHCNTYVGIYVEDIYLCKQCEYKEFRTPLEKAENKVEEFVEKIKEEEVFPVLKKVGISDFRTKGRKGRDAFLNSL